jgi:mxaJ protein
VPLAITPVATAVDGALPQTFAIAMAVRRDDRGRRERLNRFIADRRRELDAILAAYHVPRVDR